MSIRLVLPGSTLASVAVAAAGREGVSVRGDRVVVRREGTRDVVRATLQQRHDGVLVVGGVVRPRWTTWSVSVLVLAMASAAGFAALLASDHPVWAVVVLLAGGAVTAFWWLGLLVTTANTRGAVESLARSELAALLGG